jgi:hypothetical protein
MDPFEIQVYDGTANAPHAIGVELHVNGVVRGSTEAPTAPELPLNHQAHFTLEPSFGLTSFWELGGYLQTAITPDGTFRWAGVKLRSKFVTPPSFHKHLRFGLNVELSYLPPEFDASEWGMELRPIAAWENAHWSFAINPIVSLSFGNPAGAEFEPCAFALYKFGERVSLGFEWYSTFGDKPEHYIFEVVNVLAIEHVELNIGFGQGLTHESNPFIAKMIIGYTWEHFVQRPR